MNNKVNNRRAFIKAGVATVALGSVASELAAQDVGHVGTTDANTSGFRTQTWSDHFSSTAGGAILVDMESFALHFWNSDRSIYRLYPVAIPLKSEFVRRGMTSVVRKVEGPTWTPTAAMLERDPTLPRQVGPGPDNPLGTHALYLGWEYYRVHGNNDERKIGRTASSGCIGLYNQHIEELFGLVDIGCKVKLM